MILCAVDCDTAYGLSNQCMPMDLPLWVKGQIDSGGDEVGAFLLVEQNSVVTSDGKHW